jgi:phage portal protein BeeE
MIGDLERPPSRTSSNSPSVRTAHHPALISRWEQELNRKLFAPLDGAQGALLRALQSAGLLRGDLNTATAPYAIGRQWGWLSANDVRELEDLNPIDGGDVYLSPLNMVPADEAGEEENEPKEPSDPAAPPEPATPSDQETDND